MKKGLKSRGDSFLKVVFLDDIRFMVLLYDCKCVFYFQFIILNFISKFSFIVKLTGCFLKRPRCKDNQTCPIMIL